MSHLNIMILCVILSALFAFQVGTQPIILGACRDNEFQCDDGVCIPKSWQCDYEIDCSNREDEKFDPDGNECVPCFERGYFCHDSTAKCLPPQWKCDGWPDCTAGDDELYCTECTNHQFTCNDGKCIETAQLCDSIQDCYGGEDETHDINGDDCIIPVPITTVEQSKNNSITNTEQSQLTPAPTHKELPIVSIRDDTPTWKYCPSDIVWLGFVNSRVTNENENIHNTTAVYWIEPKVRGEDVYYMKYSTSYHSGDYFKAGIHTIEYIAKKIINNDTNTNITDDPIFCYLRILVLDGMRDYDIAECESQSANDIYLEWEFVVDDSSYTIAYFKLGQYTSQIDIERARFVPKNDMFHTDCYARISFQAGILQNEHEIVIEETVHWMVSHLYALIGLIVGTVLLFVILCTVIIILWRKHIEMKEFIRVSKDDVDSVSDSEHMHMMDTSVSKQRVPSTIGLDITTPGGIGYQIPYITSSQSINSYSGNGGNSGRTQFEYNMNFLNSNLQNVNENSHTKNGLSTNIDDLTDSSESGSDTLLGLKTKSGSIGGKTPPRRPSILGVNYEQLKLLTDKENKKKIEHENDELLEAEWDRQSEVSQGL